MEGGIDEAISAVAARRRELDRVSEGNEKVGIETY